MLLIPTGVAAWLTVGVSSDTQAIVTTDSEKWQQFGKVQRYTSNVVNTMDSYTEDVRSAIGKLEAQLGDLEEDWSETDEAIRTSDAHLDAALRDPFNTPLIGDDGGRNFKDSLANRATVANLYVDNFEKHSSLPDSDKVRIAGPMRQVLLGMFCMAGEYQEPLDVLRGEYKNGCRDPLVLYILMLNEERGSDQRYEYYQAALQNLEMRPVCKLLEAMVKIKANEFRNRWSDVNYVSNLEQATDAFVDAVAEQIGDAGALEMLRDNGRRHFDKMNGTARGDFVIRLCGLSEHEFPLWMQHYFASAFTRGIAKRARGSRFISETAKEDLEIAYNMNEVASKHLLRCWTLNPSCLSVIRELLSLESSNGGTPYSKQQWFRIGIANACDDEQFYTVLATYLVPKWGEPREELDQMIALCAAVDRDDLPIPLYASHFAWNAVVNQSRQLPLNAEFSLLHCAKGIIKYLKTSPSNGHGKFGGGRAMLVARVLWDWGQFSDLAWVFTEHLPAYREKEYRLSYFMNLNLAYMVSYFASRGETALWLTLHNDLFMRSDRLTEAKVAHDREIIERLREVYGKDAQWVLDHCERICDWWTTYHAGEPVLLAIDEEKLGWDCYFRERPVYVENGIEIRTPYKDSLSIMRPMLLFTGPHAIEAEVELIEGTDDYFSIALFAGPVGGENFEQSFSGGTLRFQPTLKQIVFDSLPSYGYWGDDPHRKIYSFDQAVKAKVRLEVRDDSLRGFVNSSEVEAMRRRIDTHGYVQFGRYNVQFGANDSELVRYRVTNMKVIPLAEDAEDQVSATSANLR
ncbi:hypothetical protein [Rhodopirellula sallentina]|nr:hypothetical protein [Rhodopirellula sallentina]